MSQDKQVGMINIRGKNLKYFVKIVLQFLLVFLPACTFSPHRVPPGTVPFNEATRMAFLAISVIFVHEGQSLKPRHFSVNYTWTEDLKLPLPDFSQKCEKERTIEKKSRTRR